MATSRAIRLDRKKTRQRWAVAKSAEAHYAGRLLSLARNVKGLIKSFTTAEHGSLGALVTLLEQYALTIKPWAESVAAYMLADINRRNERAWRAHGDAIGTELRRTIAQTPVGGVYRQLMDEQVQLIQSIPHDAAERVHEAVQEGMFASTRSTTLAKNLDALQDVPVWRAKLIARTETSRASTALTQARATALGSEGYVWRTSKDADVRDTHRKMEGKFVRWDSPPKTDKSLEPYHAGCGPNCFAPTTPIAGQVVAASRAFYRGKMLVIRTKRGAKLTVTPNHPVATPHGWVKAGTLRKGMDCLSDSRCIELAPCAVANEQAPTFAQDVFKTLATQGLRSQSVTPLDFHGDAAAFDGEIDVVCANGMLVSHTASEQAQSRSYLTFTAHDTGLIREPGFSGQPQLRIAANSADDSGMCGAGLPLPLLCVHSAPLQSLGFGLAAKDYPRAPETLSNDRPRYADFVGKLVDGGAARILPDEITSIEGFMWHGFVYDFQTVSGAITAGGIVTHNCRCYPEPVLPDY